MLRAVVCRLTVKALRVLALGAVVLALELRVAVAYPTRYIRNDVTTRNE